LITDPLTRIRLRHVKNIRFFLYGQFYYKLSNEEYDVINLIKTQL